MDYRKYNELKNTNLFILDASAKIQSIFSEFKDKNIRIAYSGGGVIQMIFCGY